MKYLIDNFVVLNYGDDGFAISDPVSDSDSDFLFDDLGAYGY